MNWLNAPNLMMFGFLALGLAALIAIINLKRLTVLGLADLILRWADPKGVLGASRGPSSPASLIPRGADGIPVYTFDDLVQRLKLAPLLASIESKMGLSKSNFAADARPLIQAVGELAQLFPASESHHHANPGGLLVHALESANHALSIRQGHILPPGAQPEDIAMNQHRWSYAVLVAALLHDLGKPMSDVSVVAKKGHQRVQWTPIQGSLVQCGCTEYQLSFRADREHREHERLALTFLKTLVPQPALQWLGESPAALQTLVQYLDQPSGAPTGASTAPVQNPIGKIVAAADHESVRHNLAHGSRQRFASAKSTPLIERTMDALRQMMADTEHLPLNRKGAAGWVFEGQVWFVSKRLVDEIRAYLVQNKQDQGFPGVDRNDRIFDTLQEYGVLISNPVTHGAIWQARIEQLDGWQGEFTVIRIPLAALYPNEQHYPMSMAGRIEVMDRAKTGSSALLSTSLSTHLSTNSVASTGTVIDTATSSSPLPPVALPVTLDNNREEPHLARSSEVAGAPGSSTPNTAPEMSIPTVEDNTREHREVSTPFTSPTVASDYLPPEESATAPANAPSAGLRLRLTSKAIDEKLLAQGAAASTRKSTARDGANNDRAQLHAPIVPASPVSPILQLRQRKSVPESASAVMRWIQEGVGNGTLAFNQPKALVHFATVEHESLGNVGKDEIFMLLVSPMLFKTYAIAHRGTEGFTIQKEFLKAGWHLSIKPGDTNILRFFVRQPAGQSRAVLSCVAVRYPERFVNPVPPANPVITYNHPLTTHGSKSPVSTTPGATPAQEAAVLAPTGTQG